MKNGFKWHRVTHVLLDLDGTLLDKDFDDRFWQEVVPREYARKKGIPLHQARQLAMEAYRQEEGSLNWFDIDFWSRKFDLDISLLKARYGHGIRVLPGTYRFLEFVRQEKKSLHLVTNAHPQTVAIKMERVPLRNYFHSILSAFEVGSPKEEMRFWEEARRQIGFHPERTLFIDDSPAVLESARRYGIAHVFHKAGASGSGPPKFHAAFYPLLDFSELLD